MTHHRPAPEVSAVVNATRACLLMLAAFTLGRATAYSPLLTTSLQERPPAAVRLLIAGGIPLAVWAVGWTIALLFNLWGVVQRRQPRTWTLIPSVVMYTIWGIAYGASWLLGLSPNGYIYFLSYLAMAGLIIAGSYLAGRALALAVSHDRRPA